MKTRQALLILTVLAALLPGCKPIRDTTKVGFKTAKLATRATWEVGKAGTKVATAPLRLGGGSSDDSGSSDGGGSYRVHGHRYQVMSTAQARRFHESGIASYYSGRRTANGERLSSRALTAAHKTLPFGTRVRVTNLANGRSITVRINDRGPFVRGRIIDLTKRGADALGFRKQGTAEVRLEVL